ncbi:hypothetical protein BFP72_01765 [Reichenbachiella sp. 5M10]|uniref:hypothetical protein n=1 Tax=Reichenbachiella sp. 5M10 TaxID=1889772 RepID=UPI000C156D50|nr:hypothetical protein [Reichenbachiella sp. 5M10]PIB34246.1 hypothetical protein BFP72_01765 [Reichenbachiella sp. 5M10]
MKKQSTLAILSGFLILSACQPNKQAPETDTASESLDMIDEVDDLAQHTADDTPVESNCIFDDDYYGLTTEWAEQSGLTNYRWDSLDQRLLIPYEGDTLLITKGGCDHFGISVQLRLYQDTTSMTQPNTWVIRSMELAQLLNYVQYTQVLSGINDPALYEESGVYFIDIPDDNTEDNQYYTGIKIESFDEYTALSFGSYIN